MRIRLALFEIKLIALFLCCITTYHGLIIPPSATVTKPGRPKKSEAFCQIAHFRYDKIKLTMGRIMTHLDKPKIRNVTAQRTIYQGEPVFLLQDRLKLTEAAIVLPQVLGPLVMLCDGNNTLPEIKAALEVRYGLRLPQETIEGMLAQFDQALLLEGGTFERFKQQAVVEYRTAPYRQPTLAGLSYPADPEALRQMLQGYLDEVHEVPEVSPDSRGIISPHIDYQRGGPVYAKLWASAAASSRCRGLVGTGLPSPGVVSRKAASRWAAAIASGGNEDCRRRIRSSASSRARSEGGGGGVAGGLGGSPEGCFLVFPDVS
ncbi:MAG: hypothetical protein DYH12_21845 [Sorangiineae bacterium PRO1]|nr:hypothetical protein [Sorangiineae bacterium PRO1]